MLKIGHDAQDRHLLHHPMNVADIPTLSSMLMQTTTPSDVRASADFIIRGRCKYMRIFGRRYAFFSNGTVVAVGTKNSSTNSIHIANELVQSAMQQIQKVTCSKVSPSALRYKVYGYDQVTRRTMVFVSFRKDTPGVSNIISLDDSQTTNLSISHGEELDAVKVLLAARVNVARSNDMQSQKLAYIALPDKCLYSCKDRRIIKNTGKKFIIISS